VTASRDAALPLDGATSLDADELRAKPRVHRRADWRRLRPVLESRLFQFAVLGSLLFAVAPRPPSPRDIDIRSDRLAALRAAEATRNGAPALSDTEAHAVDQRELEDEILFREGIRLGLDKNDGIVRQRIVQKVLFLAEEMAGASARPTDAELRAFFDANREQWSHPEELRLTEIYRHDRAVFDDWLAGRKTGDPPPGEPAPVDRELTGDSDKLKTILGPSFVEGLTNAPTGAWVGPIQSAYGWHLVRIEERRPGRAAQFDEVRQAVTEAYSLYRREEATASFLKEAFARYRVEVDGKPLTTFTPSRRLAFRAVASGED
jgi:peptidyl-prolyl cis-trans isomerase C